VAKREKFLEAYSKRGNIGEACKAAEVSRSTYQSWMQEEDFKQRAIEAYENAVDAAEVIVHKRGFDGYEEPVFHRGELVYRRDPATGEVLLDDDFNPIPLTVTKHSEKMVEMYMQAHRSNYRSRGTLELTGPMGEGGAEEPLTIRFVRAEPREDDPANAKTSDDKDEAVDPLED